MPNVPPDGWESAIKEGRSGRQQVAQAVDELRQRLDPPGPGGIPRQMAELQAALDALTARVEALEQRPST